MIARGDIRWVQFRLPDKRRPVVVLGRDDAIGHWHRLPVIPLSTEVRGLPWEVVLENDDGVPVRSAVKVEWIASVDRSRLGPLIGRVSEARWLEIGNRMLDVLGLDQELR